MACNYIGTLVLPRKIKKNEDFYLWLDKQSLIKNQIIMGKYKDENGTTRLGDFLRTLGDVGEEIIGVGSGLVGAPWLSKVINTVKSSDKLTPQQIETALEQHRLDALDLINARDSNVKIQDSANASWIAKNLPYFFDAFILLIWGSMTIYIIGRWIGLIENSTEVNFTGVLGIYSGVTSLATMVIQFHRGSSHGSKEKDSFVSYAMNKIKSL